MPTIFLSYARLDKELVQVLPGDLPQMRRRRDLLALIAAAIDEKLVPTTPRRPSRIRYVLQSIGAGIVLTIAVFIFYQLAKETAGQKAQLKAEKAALENDTNSERTFLAPRRASSVDLHKEFGQEILISQEAHPPPVRR